MHKRYRVTLTEEEIRVLDDILSKGKHSAQKRNRAQALLLANQGWTDGKIVEAVQISIRAVEMLRQRFVEDGFETVLAGKPKGHRLPALDGRAEAHLVALVCSAKPAGYKRWTIRTLRDRLVAELEDLESLSHETVRKTLKKMNLSLGSKQDTAFRRKVTPNSLPTWKTSLTFMNGRKIPSDRWSAWTKARGS